MPPVASVTGRSRPGRYTPRAFARKETHQVEEAITAQDASAVISREISDRQGEAVALTDLGAALREARRFEDAITAHRNAATSYREIGERRGQGVVLCNLGATFSQVDRFDEAAIACKDVMDVFRETGDLHDETLALGLRRLGPAAACARR